MAWSIQSLSRTDVPRVVRFAHPFLFWLKLALAMATIVFCGVKVMILDRGHLAADVPVGMAHVSVLDPVHQSTDVELPLFCEGSKIELHQKKSPCVVWDQDDMRSATVSGVNTATVVMSVTDRIDMRTDKFSWAPGAESHHRVAHAEDFRLRIEHMYQSPRFSQEWFEANPEGTVENNPWCGTHTSLLGFLVDHQSNILHRFSGEGPDVLSLSQLLEAAGHDADIDDNVRDRGLVLFVSIAYNNRPLPHSRGSVEWLTLSTLMPSENEVFYTYRVRVLPGATHSLTSLNYINETSRHVQTRHSVQASFVHTGEIFYMSTSLLVVTLSAAITLLQFSDMIVVATANHLLSKRWGSELLVWNPGKVN
ncbi:hypothetical protein DIPPA_65645 [Diplonema papillatum]|nr:hypothetical protein DIPPA_65645 [Diplonema papillatum]